MANGLLTFGKHKIFGENLVLNFSVASRPKMIAVNRYQHPKND